ncbi:MAG: hypothetical protein GF390_02200, partial [Candidatus Pacebacteria bacterium]|nr:hypothetical protein [Candidatus Paceibacterota bacterium]
PIMSVFASMIKSALPASFKAWLSGTLLGLVVISILASGFFFYSYQNKFYQGVYLDGLHLGGLTRSEAVKLITAKNQQPLLKQYHLELAVDEVKIASDSSQLGQYQDYQPALAQAFEVGRSGFPIQRLWQIFKLKQQPQYFYSDTAYEAASLAEMINQLKQQIDYPDKMPQISLGRSGSAASLRVEAGKVGRQLQVAATSEKILEQLHYHDFQTTLPQQKIVIKVKAQVASIGAQLNQSQIDQAYELGKKIINQQAVFKINTESQRLTLTLEDIDLVPLLNLPVSQPPQLNELAAEKLIQAWKKQLDQQPTNAEFDYDPQTLQVTKFVPHRQGLVVDEKSLQQQLKQLLTQISQADSQTLDQQEPYRYELAVKTTDPQITLADTNNLGISELIGFGDSYYYHSIPSRIHNVAVAANKLDLAIIKPGAEFSVNRAVGEVSSSTGFKPAYIIQGGATVLAEGGGVCQISTTTFRAALDAGLPITRRLPHSYRVSYYEYNQKPGVDATVYAGDTDLRFINDTDHHILVHTTTDSQNLYMTVELYGTSDGRTTEIVDHQVWGYRPPPPPVYIPDPSLPPGAKKQIDWAASGISASFVNVVKDKNGNIIRKDKYTSTYQPWSAKYLVGVGS